MLLKIECYIDILFEKSSFQVNSGLQIIVLIENNFSYFSTKTYVMGAQKNQLNKTVVYSSQNICLNSWLRKF